MTFLKFMDNIDKPPESRRLSALKPPPRSSQGKIIAWKRRGGQSDLAVNRRRVELSCEYPPKTNSPVSPKLSRYICHLSSSMSLANATLQPPSSRPIRMRPIPAKNSATVLLSGLTINAGGIFAPFVLHTQSRIMVIIFVCRPRPPAHRKRRPVNALPVPVAPIKIFSAGFLFRGSQHR